MRSAGTAVNALARRSAELNSCRLRDIARFGNAASTDERLFTSWDVPTVNPWVNVP
jgi:hypothetical protein